MPLSIGQLLFNRYQILRALNQGGMGGVYLALDRSLNTRVALKESFATDALANAQFQQEAQILGNLSNQNLPRVTNFFIEPSGVRYLVMDFVEGENLQEIVFARGRLAPGEMLTWFKTVFNAVNYLHAQPQPIIHRDINPRNIIIRPDGRAMLVDFGIAKVLTGTKTTHGLTGYGTPGYAPPEQYSGGTDQRTDVYALGATMYFALTGETPPDAPMRAAGAPLLPPVQFNAQVTPRLQEAILKAMNLNAAQRFNSVADLSQSVYVAVTQPLGNVATSPVATVQQTVTTPAPSRRAEMLPFLFGSVLGGIVLAALILGGLYFGGVLGGTGNSGTLIASKIMQTLTPSVTDELPRADFTALPTITKLPTTSALTIDTQTPIAIIEPTLIDTPTGIPTPIPPNTEVPTPTNTSIPFDVLEIQADVSPLNSSSCPTSFLFQARLRANTAGTARYRWEFSDGRVFNEAVAIFSNAGAVDIAPVTWDFGRGQEIHYSGWARVRVLEPVELLSPQAEFRIDCEVPPTPEPPTPIPPTPTPVRAKGRIVFESHQSSLNEIRVVNADGTGLRTIANNSAPAGLPTWSPDGEWVSFGAGQDNGEVYAIHTDGSGLRDLTNSAADDGAPAWSPDGNAIVFQSDQDGNYQIFIMNADGTNVRRLTNDPAWAGPPSWSPDSRSIAFESGRDGNAEIYLINPDGSNIRRLTNHPADDLHPKWSPDGQSILFYSNRNGRYQVYLMNTDGSNQHQILDDNFSDVEPTFSPDGNWIAFASNRTGTFQIYFVRPDGTGLGQLTNDSATNRGPDWTR